MAAEDNPSTACTGSSLLKPVSEITNLPLDQVRPAGAFHPHHAGGRVSEPGGVLSGAPGGGRAAAGSLIRGGKSDVRGGRKQRKRPETNKQGGGGWFKMDGGLVSVHTEPLSGIQTQS